jgi:hypothetical protein
MTEWVRRGPELRVLARKLGPMRLNEGMVGYDEIVLHVVGSGKESTETRRGGCPPRRSGPRQGWGSVPAAAPLRAARGAPPSARSSGGRRHRRGAALPGRDGRRPDRASMALYALHTLHGEPVAPRICNLDKGQPVGREALAHLPLLPGGKSEAPADLLQTPSAMRQDIEGAPTAGTACPGTAARLLSPSASSPSYGGPGGS